MNQSAHPLASQRWARGAKRAMQALGLPGVLGLLLVVLAAWLQAWQIPAMRQRTQSLLAQTQHELRETEKPVRPQPTVQDVLASFYAHLSPAAQRSAVLATVLQQAQTDGLNIDALQLRMDDQATGPVQRQVIAIPLKGQYEQVRTWLADVLNDDAALSLDELDVHRDNAISDQVQARVVLSLWLRGPGLVVQPEVNAADTAHAASAAAKGADVVELAQGAHGPGAHAAWE